MDNAVQRRYQTRLRSPRYLTEIHDEQEVPESDCVCSTISTDVFSQYRYLRCILEYLTDKSWACEDDVEVLEKAHMVLSIADSLGYYTIILQALANREAELTQSSSMVLRGDSLRIRMFVDIARVDFKPWLETVSRAALSRINKVSNSKLSPEHYYTTLEILLSAISTHTHELPSAVVVILRVVYEAFVHHDAAAATRALHSILFLRLICPMLQTMHQRKRRMMAGRRDMQSSSCSEIPLRAMKLTKCLLILVNRLTDNNIELCAELKVHPIKRLESLQKILVKIFSIVTEMIGTMERSKTSSDTLGGYDSDYDISSPQRTTRSTSLRHSKMQRECSIVYQRSISEGTVVGVKAYTSSILADHCRHVGEKCWSVGTYLLSDLEQFKKLTPLWCNEDVIRQVTSRDQTWEYDSDTLVESSSSSNSPFSSPVQWVITFYILCNDETSFFLSDIKEIVVYVTPSPSSSCRNDIFTSLDEELSSKNLSKKPFHLYTLSGIQIDCSPETTIEFENLLFHECRIKTETRPRYGIRICFCLDCT